MTAVFNTLFWLSTLGVMTSTGFLVLLLIATMRFHSHRRNAALAVDAELPPATMMKPLCGMEPRLEENLESFFLQDYPDFEIIFGTRNEHDPALEVVRRLCKKHPQVPVKIVYSGEPDKPNAKVCTLREMFAKTTREYVVISDSDVGVQDDYLRRVVAPLLDDEVGMVMCLYRGVPTGGFWSGMEALGMSVEMTAGVVAASTVGEVDFALGPTMATRREVVESVGGIAMLADYCADDYVLGNLIARSGRKVLISEHVIDHYVLNRSFAASMRHQRRWMVSTRFSIPAGHASSVLSFAIPYGIVAAAAGALCGHTLMGAGLLAWTVVNRVILSIAVGWGVVRDWRALGYCWLYPLRDLMGFGFWVASYSGSTVDWRGEKYQLVRNGRMVRRDAAGTKESVVVGINNLS